MKPPLTGNVAIVTGATGGIGSAIARRLARDGAAVAVDHMDDQQAAADLVADIRATGGLALAIEADVRDADQIRYLHLAVQKVFGPVDVLVSAAGSYPRIPWPALRPDTWERQINVNLTSHFLMAREISPSMARRGTGRIITIGSVLADAGRHDLAAYIAAKAGLEGLTRALARELGPSGVTTNCVAPGSIMVAAEAAVVPDPVAMEQRQLDRQCVKRRGAPDDVAAAVAFLAGADAGFITGQTVRVDGGWILG